jgi:hypothetical protein
LGSGNGKEGMYNAILNGFKHHPLKTVGAGTGILTALGAREELLYKQNTDQHRETTAVQQEEQARTFLFKALSQAEDSKKNAYDRLEKALKSRDQDFIASAKDGSQGRTISSWLNLIQRERVEHDSLGLKISKEDMNQLKIAKQDSLDLKVEVVDLDFKPKCPFEPTSISDYLAFIF